MGERYELIYGFLHCVGRTQYHAGYAESLDTAERWAKTRAWEASGGLGVPETDPLRGCPVRHCHRQRQQPWFGYRSMDGVIGIRRTADG